MTPQLLAQLLLSDSRIISSLTDGNPCPPRALHCLICLPTRSSARDGLSGSPPADSEICRRREGLPRRRAAQGRADELPAETVRVRRLRMVVALERVGHGLSNAIPGLEAA